MKRSIVAIALYAILTSSASAQTLGASMAYFDDNFLTSLREAMTARAQEVGASIQFEDAQGDVGKQLSQLQNFIAQGVDAIVMNPVDTSATPRMTKLATEAGIPLVYVNRQPEEQLPEGVIYVGSDENVSGKLQAEEIARLLNNEGKIVIMMGELATNAATLRTEGVEKVAAQHEGMEIVEKQTANWQRNEAIDLMNNWLVSGIEMDAIAANNDEMAIGAIIALQQAGRDPKELVIAGVDATPDGLAEVARGNLDVTVFQDARGQGRAVVDSSVSLINGEPVDTYVMVPFELVTPENYKEFLDR